MASQVLSGANNASYTNNTGQNVRLIINYMSNVTSMAWAGVTVSATATTIGKDVSPSFTSNITFGTRLATVKERNGRTNLQIRSNAANNEEWGTLYVYPSRNGYGALELDVPVINNLELVQKNASFPTEIMLANGETFSSICGAFNAIIIKEDGT